MRHSAKFLILCLTTVATASPLTAQAPLDHRELPADQQVIHALNRLTFGARPGDVQRVRAMGLDKWVDQQLHPERIKDPRIDQIVGRYPALAQDQTALLASYAEAQRSRRMAAKDSSSTDRVRPGKDMAARQVVQSRRRVVTEVQSARVARAVAGERQLEEVMTDFWLNHFNVYDRKGPPEAFYLADYEREAIRPHALGKFRELLANVAKSPAMLFYLDNARSMAASDRPRLGNARARGQVAGKRGGLNENYGRELLELHTLGVDGGYTQQDVINVARALTGWTIKQPALGGGFIFRPQIHDAGSKTVLGHKLAANRGMEDGEDVLTILSRHPATARYISTKLARRFISDSPPQSVIDRASAVFLRTDGDIREVVKTIITSNEFYAQQAYRAKVKSPFEVVVSAMRAMNAQPDSTPRTAQMIAYLGQPLFGHQAPNGYPETGDAWMNSGAILNRINFGMAAAANRIPGARVEAIPGLDSISRASRAQQVDAVVAGLLGGFASPDTRAVLLSGENPMLPAGSLIEVAMDGDRAMRVPQLKGISQVVGLALGSPEFQRR
ncbi:MAG: DUF1800 domain-containing protein [Gemmatimonadaceae bacterium]